LLHGIARQNLYLLLEASHGTTMQVTSAMIYFLNHPDNITNLERLRREVALIDEPTYESLKGDMPFAASCINETMRLSPFIGSIMYQIKKGKSIELNGKTVHGPIALNFMHSHWYDDAEVFKFPEKFLPQRWLSGDEYEVSSFARNVFKPFGSGRHICIGMDLAKLVMKANLYSFAKKPTRSLVYETSKVKIVSDFIPERKVSDHFFGKIVHN